MNKINKEKETFDFWWSFIFSRFKIIQPPKKPKIPELPREKSTKREDDAASMPPPPSPASSTCSDGSLSNPAGGPPVPSPAPTWRQKRSAPKVSFFLMKINSNYIELLLHRQIFVLQLDITVWHFTGYFTAGAAHRLRLHASEDDGLTSLVLRISPLPRYFAKSFKFYICVYGLVISPPID